MARRQIYTPINPSKYNGNYPIVLKSSWEVNFARFYCDLNSSCLEWAYEPWRIPYRDPINERQSIYIPDFLIAIKANNGGVKTALIEIKPLKETLQEHARSRRDAMNIARNLAKWDAAIAWCQRRKDVEFHILTEAQLFAGGENIKPRKHPIRPYAKRRTKRI